MGPLQMNSFETTVVQDDKVIDGLMMLWRRMCTEFERRTATPALRLLDDVLALLTPAAGGTYEDRYVLVLFVFVASASMDVQIATLNIFPDALTLHYISCFRLYFPSISESGSGCEKTLFLVLIKSR